MGQVMTARAVKYKCRTMNMARLEKKGAVVKTEVKAGVLQAERLADLDNTLRELVGLDLPRLYSLTILVWCKSLCSAAPTSLRDRSSRLRAIG